jgi:ferric-dicitrate binding protein FerR (iron transport regulator)
MSDEQDDTIARLVRMAGRRPGVDPERMARVREAVRAEWQRDVNRRRTRTALMAIASVAVAATLAAVLLFLPKSSPPERILETATTHDWNGATLRLSPGTRVRVGEDIAVLEAGTVYYSSGTRTDQITIRTPLGDVRDVGTAFEVKLDQQGLHVRVDQGLVELRGTTIGAGMSLFATATTVEQLITLEGQTLREVVERVAKAKELSVRWETSARDAKLHGDVPLPLDEALDAATAAAGVRYRIEGKELVVSP